jgi:hypothetical protein
MSYFMILFQEEAVHQVVNSTNVNIKNIFIERQQ